MKKATFRWLFIANNICDTRMTSQGKLLALRHPAAASPHRPIAAGGALGGPSLWQHPFPPRFEELNFAGCADVRQAQAEFDGQAQIH